MGQILVITIRAGEEELAKAYYHWEGYTASALETTNIALEKYKKAYGSSKEYVRYRDTFENKLDPEEYERTILLRTALLMLFATGAGLEVDREDGRSEINEFKSLFPATNYIVGENRNEGLIAFSQKGMSGLQEWSEADVVIDIENQKVDISGLFFEPEEEIIGKTYDLGNINLNNIDFYDLESLIAIVIYELKKRIYDFRINGKILSAIA